MIISRSYKFIKVYVTLNKTQIFTLYQTINRVQTVRHTITMSRK